VEAAFADPLARRAELWLLDLGAELGKLPSVILRLRRSGRSEIPIVLMTDDDSDTGISSLFRMGATDVLLRPLRSGELRAKVARLIRRSVTTLPSRIPRRIGPYELQEPIGRGATSAVFRAWPVDHPERDLALKVMWPQLVGDGEAMQRFRREIDILQDLDHDGLVRFIASGRQDDWFYYVMEHIEGGTLRDLIGSEGACNKTQALKLIAALCAPLGYLHRKGLIHRDVKPENIYLEDERIVLGDFGLAKQFTDRGITLAADVIGTPLYLAPEAFNSVDVDRRADLYSVGMCALEWLNGGPIVEESDPVRLITLISSGRLPRPREILPELDEDLAAILDGCLEPDPEKRLSDADGLCHRARELITTN